MIPQSLTARPINPCNYARRRYLFAHKGISIGNFNSMQNYIENIFRRIMLSTKCSTGGHWRYFEAGGFKAKTTNLDDYAGRVPKEELSACVLQFSKQ